MGANDGLVQPIPPGLLSVLGLKTRGKSPDSLQEAMQLSIEARDWLLLSAPVETDIATGATFDNTGNLVSGFNSIPTVVPNGEIWWIWDHSTYIRDLATTTTLVAIQALYSLWAHPSNGTTGNAFKIGVSSPKIDLTYAGASPAIYIGAPSISGFWAESGSGPSLMYTGKWTGGTPLPHGRTRFSRIKI